MRRGRALFAQGCASSSRGEVVLLRRDGRRVPTLVSMTTLQPHGVPALCVIVADLTAQKRDQELLLAEQLARSVIEQGAEGIVVCDGDGVVQRASRGAALLCAGNPLLQPFDASFRLSTCAAGARQAETPLRPRSLREGHQGPRGAPAHRQRPASTCWSAPARCCAPTARCSVAC